MPAFIPCLFLLMSHYEILRNDADLVCKINTKEFEAVHIVNNSPKTFIEFNGPYFGGSPIEPIGPFAEFKGYPTRGTRPVVFVNDVSFVAGPDLFNLKKSIEEGQFGQDITNRRTDRMVVGYTKPGKLILAYLSARTLTEASQEMKKLGCIRAINCDGGHSASLRVGKIRKGSWLIRFGVGLRPRT